ncbi:hypothetical protein MLD38_017340 [Melastoma candidum]|uniref:Uncharacterized protein n=1 Tax=Melastoma candidum TaxID=119954 RepID=A0ACB9QRG2_9MYRT|nr:hypothetical protein MLD38_017340 [Melastoma candidum]
MEPSWRGMLCRAARMQSRRLLRRTAVGSGLLLMPWRSTSRWGVDRMLVDFCDWIPGLRSSLLPQCSGSELAAELSADVDGEALICLVVVADGFCDGLALILSASLNLKMVLKDGLSVVLVPYGFAIILLTVIVMVATLPLTKQQIRRRD